MIKTARVTALAEARVVISTPTKSLETRGQLKFSELNDGSLVAGSIARELTPQ